MLSTVSILSVLFFSSRLTAFLGAAPDAVRVHIMRHNPFTGVFNGSYLNGRVRFNFQDAFLEEDISDDGLTRAFTHIWIKCILGAPVEVPSEVLNELPHDPEIAENERRHKELHHIIRSRYGYINQAPD